MGVLAALTALWGTSTAIRRRWAALSSCYHAVETDSVVRAMDRPHDEARRALETGRALTGVLTAYADRVREINAWSEAVGTDPVAVHTARQLAEQACAAAVTALLDAHHGPATAAVPTAWVSSSEASIPAPTRRQAASFGHDRAGEDVAGFAFPGADHHGVTQRGFASAEVLGLAASAHASWMVNVEHGIFRPRDASGRFVSAATMTPTQRLRAGAGRSATAGGAGTIDRLRSFEPGGNTIAKGHRRTAHAHWSRTSTTLGRVNTGVSLASTGWSQWQGSSGESTSRRIGGTAVQTAATGGGAWAGGQAGAWAGGALGTAILPGAGTVVGATVGGVLGGVAGSEAGSWVGEHLHGLGADAGEAVGEGVGRVGDVAADVGGDVLDTLDFWRSP